MTLTNNQNLPEPLVRAVQWSDRDREGCHYTVTELLRPARMVALERQFAEQITEDASDRLWLLLGSAGHTVLERSAHKGIVEERAVVDVEVDGKSFKVGGKLDYGVSDTTLFDYKFTSVYAAKEGPRDEWTQQLNIYRWLAHLYGVFFDKLQIVAIFRDWSKPKASREPDYPQSQVKVMDLPLWPDATIEQFICDRIRAHETAKAKLPLCTAEDMWEKPEMFAVKKKGGKRAIRLYESEVAAVQHQNEDPRNLEIEHRPAERTRCESYCRCAPFCEQWKAFRQAHP